MIYPLLVGGVTTSCGIYCTVVVGMYGTGKIDVWQHKTGYYVSYVRDILLLLLLLGYVIPILFLFVLFSNNNNNNKRI